MKECGRDHPAGTGGRLWAAPSVRSAIGLSTIVLSAIVACTDSSSRAGDSGAVLQLDPLVRIDGEGGQRPAGFGRIVDVEIHEDGSVFVLDGMTRTIQVFDREGIRLRTFAGQGSGPGELERPVGLAWGPDGDLWVPDLGNGRYTVFDTNGELVATYRHSGGAVFGVHAFRFGGPGQLQVVADAPEGGSLERMNTVLIEAEVEEDQVTERRRVELPFVEEPSVFRFEGGDLALLQLIPFTSEPLFDFDGGGGLWYADTRAPWVYRWSPSAGLQDTLGRTFVPPAVTEADLEDVLGEEGIEELRRVAGRETFAEFEELIPGTKPHLEGFFFDDAGNAWIVRSGGSGDRGRRVDVYRPDGTLLATGRASFELDPAPRVRDGLLAGVVRDELGVESVVLHRIRR